MGQQSGFRDMYVQREFRIHNFNIPTIGTGDNARFALRVLGVTQT